jgi:repressor LexA
MTTAVTPKPLTERQREILTWISQYIDAHGYSPTLRELCRAFGFVSPNGAKCHLVPLARKGHVTWNERQSRTLRVLEVSK